MTVNKKDVFMAILIFLLVVAIIVTAILENEKINENSKKIDDILKSVGLS